MADMFQITPPTIRAEGKDVPPEQIQAGFNSLARQTQIGLNSVATDPTGPASGYLSGFYPAPTVVAVHATGGTLDGVVIGGTTPAAANFTTVSATTPIPVTSGGTGQNALNAHNVLIGKGSSAVGFAAPGTAGQMLISTGAAVDPAFANNPVITGGTIDNAPIGQTTPAAGNFTTLASTGGAVNGTVGATTPNTGSFTTLSATSTVSGAGFTSLFASPPPVGSTAANTGAFTTLSASSTVSGTGFVNRFASPGPIGNTAASTGAFTTLSSTGTFTPSSTNGIVGTTTNDNANVGSVGEFVTATALASSVSNGVALNAASISLTAGDWDVHGVLRTAPAGTTVIQQTIQGISTTSATLGAFGTFTADNHSLAAGSGGTEATPVVRLSLASTTTVFLISTISFTTSTCTVDGLIRARRVR